MRWVQLPSPDSRTPPSLELGFTSPWQTPNRILCVEFSTKLTTLTALSTAPMSHWTGCFFIESNHMQGFRGKKEAMVKIKLSISRKKYLRGKRVYQHRRGHLPLPTKNLRKLEPYLKEDFEVEIAEDDSRVLLIYTYWKKPKQPPTPALSDHIL